MSSVLRFEPRDVVSGVGSASDPVPGASPLVAVRPSASPWPAGDSRLLPCPHCGVLNGRSASTCWGCEAGLSEAAAPMKPGAVQALAGADAASPEPTVPLEARDALALSHPGTLALRRMRRIVAAVASVGLAGIIGGAYRYISAPDFGAIAVTPPPPVAVRAIGVVVDAEPMAPAPAVAEPVHVATGVPAALRSVPGAVPKPDRRGAARHRSAALRSCTATVASLGLCDEVSAKAPVATSVHAPLPNVPRPEPVPQMSAPPGRCTAVVASLGLCAAAPEPAKE